MIKDKKKKQKKVIEYNKFIQEFEFVHLQGLKGLEKACQIQQKSSNKMFDYVEMDLRGVDTIDSYEEYCEKLLDIDQKEILLMKFYSRVFVEETLGDPFCKYFLIFEYCESSLETEIQHLKRRSKQIKKSTVKKVFESIAIALNHFHTQKIVHGDIRTAKVFKNEEQQYKLMPPKIKVRKSTEKYYHSPEYHLSKNYRAAYDKATFNPQICLRRNNRYLIYFVQSIKAEIYTFGMVMLEIGTFLDDLQDAYGKFHMNEEVIQNALSRFSLLYGYHLTAVVKKMLNLDSQLRPTAYDIIELLQSQDLHEMEKEINNSIKTPMMRMNSDISEGDEDGNSSPMNNNKNTPAQEEKFTRDTNKKSTFFQIQGHSSQTIQQVPLIKITQKTVSIIELSEQSEPMTVSNGYQTKKNANASVSFEKTPATFNSLGITPSKSKTSKSPMNNHQGSFGQEARMALHPGKVQKASKMKEKAQVEEEEGEEDMHKEERIFKTLPQEYQDEVDSKVNQNLKGIEKDYQIDYLPNGHRYQGEKLNGLSHGWGIFWWANGEMYSGEFLNGKYHGIGTYCWPTGEKHYGEFFKGEIQGLGARFYQEGDIYFGEWSKGRNQGKGTFYWQVSQAKFKGNFLKDKIYGKGTLILPIFEDKENEQGADEKKTQSKNLLAEKDTNKLKETRIYEGLWKDEENKGLYVEEIEFSAQNESEKARFTLDQDPKVPVIRWKP